MVTKNNSRYTAIDNPTLISKKCKSKPPSRLRREICRAAAFRKKRAECSQGSCWLLMHQHSRKRSGLQGKWGICLTSQKLRERTHIWKFWADDETLQTRRRAHTYCVIAKPSGVCTHKKKRLIAFPVPESIDRIQSRFHDTQTKKEGLREKRTYILATFKRLRQVARWSSYTPSQIVAKQSHLYKEFVNKFKLWVSRPKGLFF